ncbi:MAG TPA: hypothetical protein VJG90_05400 [Candidatus Nanoarchaeia archaeon]|nr:hypothetical protein [Candidatus Nanoarchaeia archaeon]
MDSYEVRVLSPIPTGPFRGSGFIDQIRRREFWVERDQYGRALMFILGDAEDEVHTLFPDQPLNAQDLGLLVIQEADVARPGLVHAISVLLRHAPARVESVRRFQAKQPSRLLDQVAQILRPNGYEPIRDGHCVYWKDGLDKGKGFLRTFTGTRSGNQGVVQLPDRLD